MRPLNIHSGAASITLCVSKLSSNHVLVLLLCKVIDPPGHFVQHVAEFIGGKLRYALPRAVQVAPLQAGQPHQFFEGLHRPVQPVERAGLALRVYESSDEYAALVEAMLKERQPPFDYGVAEAAGSVT